MYELIALSEHDFYIDCPAKIGLCKISETDVVAIDSGSDKDAGKKVLKHIESNGWHLAAIYATHSHADHIGGCRLLQDRTGCKVYAAGLEAAFTKDPILEPMTLYGGNPFADLRHKFLLAQACSVEELTPEVLPKGWEMIPLPGHSFDMVGFKTADGNIFLADCVSSTETLQKYGIGYLWDVEKSLATLEAVKTLKAPAFIPAHAPVVSSIEALCDENAASINGACETVLNILEEPKSFDDLLAGVFDAYGLTMNAQQFVLIGSTVRSILSYLLEKGQVGFSFEENRMLWKAKESA